MTSQFPRTSTLPDRYFGPGLNIVDKRPENSNQDMFKRHHLVDFLCRDVFAGAGTIAANEQAATQFRYPEHTRL